MEENYFVYKLYSKILDVYYKGFTTNISQRIEYHLEDKSTFTSKVNDWKLVYSSTHNSKKEALKEEKRIKKLNRISLEKLIVKV